MLLARDTVLKMIKSVLPAVVAEHSRAFEEFMAKFDKAASYCPDSGPPCEESTRRERVFLENLVAIEKHNAEPNRAREGGMKLGVTRFADLTPDEFANHHGHAHAGAATSRASSAQHSYP